MGRAPCCDKNNGLKKGPWTPEEDQKLVDYIQNHGYGNWRTLPKNAGLQRCGKSCRLRWTNYLRPDIKRGRFSFEEEETIIQLHSILGNKWSAIASRLPGRTDNEIKNYWNTHIRKRLLRMGIDPVTHSPRLDLLDLSSILIHNNNNNSMHPMMLNPHLLKLASSIFSSQQQQQQRDHHQNLDFTSYHHPHDDPQIQNQNPTSLPQEQHFVQIQDPVNNMPPLNNDNVNAYPLNNLTDQSSSYHNWDLSSLTEEEYIPQLSSYDYYSSDNHHNHHLMDTSLLSEASTTFHSNNNLRSFAASVMSTPSSSPTTLNNSNSTTEDERDSSYVSSDNMLRFDQIPDVLMDVVTQFCDNNVVNPSDYYY